ncbi:unnamed protein product [Orchesella dallaii]|uniref:F-box domain-containing protein n=1 Tax=Orchesella dallaii TaxID=48710 RepID=A0ABP1R4H6_9HEXA
MSTNRGLCDFPPEVSTKVLQYIPTNYRDDVLNCRLDDQRCDLERVERMPQLLQMLQELGEHLTSLHLHRMDFDFNRMVALLHLTPNLKMLEAGGLHITNNFATMHLALPPLPSLKDLVNLKLCAEWDFAYEDLPRSKFFILWLAVGNATQLFVLVIVSELQIPPLTPFHNYLTTVEERHFVVGTTNEDGFKNLKRLYISTPSILFLDQTFTPALKQLTLSGVDSENHPDLRLISQFVDRFCSTLEALYLLIAWEDMMGFTRDLVDRRVTWWMTLHLENFSGANISSVSQAKDLLDDLDHLVLKRTLEATRLELHYAVSQLYQHIVMGNPEMLKCLYETEPSGITSGKFALISNKLLLPFIAVEKNYQLIDLKVGVIL